jgi:hypothetical protein
MMTKLSNIQEYDKHDSSVEFGEKLLDGFEVIKKEVEASGVQGLIGLLTASISRYSLKRKALLAFGRQFCPPSHSAILRELLDVFQGDDPKRHRWTVQSDGTYSLLA